MSALTRESMVREVQDALGLKVDGVDGPVTWAEIFRQVTGREPVVARFSATGESSAPSGAAIAGPEMDERTQRCLASLLPPVAELALKFLRAARSTGLDVRIISGTRSYEEQAELYAKGRSTAGPKVTDAPAGHSNHNFGLAFDVGIFQNGRYLDDGKVYRDIAPIGKKLGLSWGGDWQSIQDEPHYELRPKWAADLSESQMLAELRERRNEGKDLLS